MAAARMARPVKFLPYHLQHKRRGTSRQGKARNTHGLMVRGVVMKTYIPDNPIDVARFATRAWLPGAETGILCDVLVIDTEYKTYLRDVPIMTGSSGLNDYEVWRPRESSLDMTGLPLNFSLEGLPTTTSATHNMDGDHVIVAFLANDSSQPIIIGQLPHPRSHRRPSIIDPLKPQFKWRRFIRGIDVGVTLDGNLELDLTAASDGSIAPLGGVEIPSPLLPTGLVGNINITMFPGLLPTAAKVRIMDAILSAPEPVIMGTTFISDMDILLGTESAAWGEVLTAIAGFGFPVVNITAHIAQIALTRGFILTSLVAGLPYLSSHLEVD